MRAFRITVSWCLLVIFTFPLLVKSLHVAGILHSHDHHHHAECRIGHPGLNPHEDHEDCPLCSYEFAVQEFNPIDAYQKPLTIPWILLRSVISLVFVHERGFALYLRGPPMAV